MQSTPEMNTDDVNLDELEDFTAVLVIRTLYM
jgi:hypothetical protein